MVFRQYAGFYFNPLKIPCPGQPFNIETGSMCKDISYIRLSKSLTSWEHFLNMRYLSKRTNIRYTWQQVPPVSEPCVHIASDQKTVYMGKRHRDFTNQINRLRPMGSVVEPPPSSRKFHQIIRKYAVLGRKCVLYTGHFCLAAVLPCKDCAMCNLNKEVAHVN